jgi:acyl dehydratase
MTGQDQAGGWIGTIKGMPAVGDSAERSRIVSSEDVEAFTQMTGDRNPLHADPEFAKAAGFPEPILHGLCSYGIVLRELTDGLLGGDADKVGGFTARFAGVVFMGDTIEVSAWQEDGQVIASAAIAGGDRDGSPVLADCVLTPA